LTVNEDGFISEVFLSFQGEGLYVGRRQLFVRFAGCGLECTYCDTVESRIHPASFTAADRAVPNPVTAADLLDIARSLVEGIRGLHSISVTGGEPLEQPDFLASFLPPCRSLGLPLYLETNGLHPDAARSVFPLVDIISLDIKLPSLCGGGDLFALYEQILPLAAGCDIFCKVVLADGLDRGDFERAVDLMARRDRRTPLVIQPATPVEGCGTVGPDLLDELYSEAAARLEDVRIIPQCHRLLGIR